MKITLSNTLRNATQFTNCFKKHKTPNGLSTQKRVRFMTSDNKYYEPPVH